jgi:hypothetical protein
MSDTPNQGAASADGRIDQFRSDIDDLKIAGSGQGEQRLLVVGIVLMVAGVALAILGAVQVGASGGSPADQRAYMAQGSLLGLTLAVVGAALFVRYSFARYLRFWLIRSTYEGRANADRVVSAIERASGLEPEVAPAPAPTAAPAQATPAPTSEPATYAAPAPAAPAPAAPPVHEASAFPAAPAPPAAPPMSAPSMPPPAPPFG